MNVANLAEAALEGFLISLFILEISRALVGDHWPVQVEGFQIERRILPWVLAIVAGPALIWDAGKPFRQRERGTWADCAAALVIFAAWSLSYGLSVHWLVGHIA